MTVNQAVLLLLSPFFARLATNIFFGASRFASADAHQRCACTRSRRAIRSITCIYFASLHICKWFRYYPSRIARASPAQLKINFSFHDGRRDLSRLPSCAFLREG